MACGYLPCVPPCVVPCASSRWPAPILASAFPYVQSFSGAALPSPLEGTFSGRSGASLGGRSSECGSGWGWVVAEHVGG